MPVMDGITATAQIAELSGEEGIPIVGLTANIMENERSELLQAGAADILFKPLDEQQLLETIAELTGRTLSEQRGKTAGLLESVTSKRTLKQELGQLLNKVEQAINNNDMDSAAQLIHEMQGLSGIFGTSDITAAIESLRSTLKMIAPDNDTSTLLDAIKATINKL